MSALIVGLSLLKYMESTEASWICGLLDTKL